jgi:hypothetical protein
MHDSAQELNPTIGLKDMSVWQGVVMVYRLTKVLLGPAMLYLSMTCGQAGPGWQLLKRSYDRFRIGRPHPIRLS